MNASELLDTLNQRGVQVWVDRDKLTIRSPKGMITPELREQLATHKSDLLALLKRDDDSADDCPSLTQGQGLSIQTIGRLIGGFDGSSSQSYKPPVIRPQVMAKQLSVTFRPLPNRYKHKEIITFRHELEAKLREHGVRVEPWDQVTTDFKYDVELPLVQKKLTLKRRVVKARIDAVIDVERSPTLRRTAEGFVAEKIYQLYSRFVWRHQARTIVQIAKLIGWAEEHAAKYIEDPTSTQVVVITKLNHQFVDPNLSYKQKISIGLNALINTFSEIVIGVSSDKISILNMNLSDTLFSRQELDRFVLKSLIPKVFVPIAPLLLSRFKLGEFDPHQSSYATQLLHLSQALASTDLFPAGFKLSQVIQRQSYRDIVDVIVNGRTGVSYGFVAYAEAPQYVGAIEIPEAEWNALSPVAGFKDTEVRQNQQGRRYVKIQRGTTDIFHQIPDIWLASSRSGSDKTNLDLDHDILRIGLTNTLLLQLPRGIDVETVDIKPSYDLYVMMAIALSAALYTPELIQNGAPMVHFHGYPSIDWFEAHEYVAGVDNPSVPCGTYESGVFNFLGLYDIAHQQDGAVKLAALVEPDHGTNIIAQDLDYLITRLKDGCETGLIELGGRHFQSLKTNKKTNMELPCEMRETLPKTVVRSQ
ncbi:MAG: hypothetical protein ACFE0I_10745 [Elainellaceae cyanobacterium]